MWSAAAAVGQSKSEEEPTRTVRSERRRACSETGETKNVPHVSGNNAGDSALCLYVRGGIF